MIWRTSERFLQLQPNLDSLTDEELSDLREAGDIDDLIALARLADRGLGEQLASLRQAFLTAASTQPQDPAFDVCAAWINTAFSRASELAPDVEALLVR